MHRVAQAALGLSTLLRWVQAWPADIETGTTLSTASYIAPVPVATRTFVSVDSSTTRYTPNHFITNVVNEFRYTTIRTGTEPATLTDLPTTVLQRVDVTVQSTWYETTYLTDRWGQVHEDVILGTAMSSGSRSGIDTSTWVVHRPAATHLPAGTQADALPCDQCAAPNATPPADARCAAHNLATACQGQCKAREDGLLWCYRMLRSVERYPGKAMGRVCWGNETEYAQLLEPCVQGDYSLGCVPCKGLDWFYSPKDWTEV